MTPRDPGRPGAGRVSAPVASIALTLAACGGAQPGASPPDADAAVRAVLDDWHAAAAASDEARYFDHFADDGVFLGTDATERWGVAAFREYAHRPFSEGRGWVMRATRRDVVVEGSLAWFDEDLETRNLGPSRGSGVLRYDGERWRIVQYNLTVTVPNERFAAVRAAIEAEPESAPEDAPREE